MNEYSYLHEVEDVWLLSDTVRWCKELWQVFPELGFTLDDDVFTIDQSGKPPLWQSPSIVSVHVMRGDREVYDEHSQWDRLQLRFLLATLPASSLDVFVDKAASTSDRLGLPMLYRGHTVTRDELRSMLEACVAELRESVGEPGSKDVAAAIEMTYPRR